MCGNMVVFMISGTKSYLSEVKYRDAGDLKEESYSQWGCPKVKCLFLANEYLVKPGVYRTGEQKNQSEHGEDYCLYAKSGGEGRMGLSE